MRKIFQQLAAALSAALLSPLLATCVGEETIATFFPASDPSNQGGWVLDPTVSDEFESSPLDAAKWFVQGTDGVYESNFIGRAPSQFSTKNVRIEDGKLKLAARWEPEFDFSEELDFSHKAKPEGTAFENITTAAVISKHPVHYGYLEIKCQAASGSVTSSFWMTGSRSELDIFEFMAEPAQQQKTHLAREFWSSIHDWSKPGGPTTWTDKLQLDWKVADGFHIYGLEWDENYLNFFADGKQIRRVTREQVGDDGWVITKPMKVWVDSETFPWHGIPTESDLPVDYEIEYIRVWGKQLESTSPVDAESLFYSFESPMRVGGKEVDWWIPPNSTAHFSVSDGKAASGSKSLRFTQSGALASTATAFALPGALRIDRGEHAFSMQVWLEPNCSVKRLRVILQEPWLELKPFDLSGVETGKWVTLQQKFQRNAASGTEDRPRIVVEPQDITDYGGTLHIDTLAFEKL